MMDSIRRMLRSRPTFHQSNDRLPPVRNQVLNEETDDFWRLDSGRKGYESARNDAFHLPYPADANHACLANFEGMPNPMNDPILSLPSELSDLIFSFLSIPSLGAARCTSRAWRSKIMCSRHILASVLNDNSNRDDSLRELLKILDRDCDIPHDGHPYEKAFNFYRRRLRSPYHTTHYDAGRIRVRVNTFHFSKTSNLLGDQADNSNIQLLSVHIKTSSSNTFLLLEAVGLTDAGTSPGERHIIYIYRFRPEHFLDSQEPPDQRLEFGGSIHLENLNGPIEIEVTELKVNEAWILHLREKHMTWSSARLFSLVTKKGFSNHEPRFESKPLASGVESLRAVDHGDHMRTYEYPSNQGLDASDKWRMINEIHLHGESHHEDDTARDQTTSTAFFFMNGAIRYHIVQEVSSGSLALAYTKYQHPAPEDETKSPAAANPQFQPLLVLLPPTADSLFQNIAWGTRIVQHPHGLYLRIAIIWSDYYVAMQANQSVLYIYELSQEMVFKSFGTSEVSSLSDIHQTPGRRVQSLPPGLGGVHRLSIVVPAGDDAQISSSPQSSQVLSTKQSSHSTSSEHSSTNLSGMLINNQRCFVWGPSNSKDIDQGILCKVFNFALDERWRDHRFTKSILENSDCACALHDLAYHVVLPSLTVPTPVPAPRTVFSTRTALEDKCIEDIGKIYEVHSPARFQALDRRSEWLMERIRGLWRAGFTEFTIGQQWLNSSWSGWGGVRKPEGWRTAGISTLEELEERYPSINIAAQDLRVERYQKSLEDPSRMLRKRELESKEIMGDG